VTSREDEFNVYFDEILKEASTIRRGMELSNVGMYSDDKVSVSRISFKSSQNVSIAGWLTEPQDTSQRGAVIQFPAYGEVLFPQINYAAMGLIGFSVSVRGHHGSDNEISPGFPGLLTSGLPGKDNYIYRDIVIDAIRGLIELSGYTGDSIPVVAVGWSQGAALSIILAALTKEVMAVSAEVPWLCNIEESLGLVEGFPYRELNGYISAHPNKKDIVLETLNYFDICNHAPNVDCPVLLGLGTDDPVTPITSTRKLASMIKNVKTYEYEGAGHEGGGMKHRLRQTDWIEKNIAKP